MLRAIYIQSPKQAMQMTRPSRDNDANRLGPVEGVSNQTHTFTQLVLQIGPLSLKTPPDKFDIYIKNTLLWIIWVW